MVLSGHPHLIEQYYSEGLYPVICRLLHPLLSLVPFSVGDLFFIAVVAYLIYALYFLARLTFKKEFNKALKFLFKIVIGLQTGFLVFYLFWGLNYFRPSAAERLNLRDTDYSTADLKTVTAILIDSANQTRAKVTPGDLSQNNSAIFKTAEQAIRDLGDSSAVFKTYSPVVKPSILTPAMNYAGTAGYFNPFTGEAQINYEIPVFDRPFVACHEMSHQMGFGPEDEADFAGFLAAIASHDRLLRYSAFHNAVAEFMYALHSRDTLASRELKPRISLIVRNDFKAERAYWRNYQGKINALSSLFYDHYLKSNNQPHGLNTYNRMVLLIMALHRKKVHSS